MKRKITKFASIIGLTGIATATSIVMFNEPIIKNQKETNETLNSSYLLQDINQDDLIALSQNEDVLVKELSNKYDENKIAFSTWNKNDINIFMTKSLAVDSTFTSTSFFNSLFDLSTTEELQLNFKDKSTFKDLSKYTYERSKSGEYSREYLYSNWDAYYGEVKVYKVKKLNITVVNNSYKNAVGNPTMGFDSKSKSKQTFVGDTPLSYFVPAGTAVGYNGYTPPGETYRRKNGELYTKESYFIKKYQLDTYKYDIASHRLSTDKYDSATSSSSKYINVLHDYYFDKSKETKFNIKEGSVPFSLKESNINWDKFFVLNIDNVENNGTYYTGTNRPSINFGLNIPLVNAINWYGKTPVKFINLKSKMKEIENKWSSHQFLFNEIFGSKENFFNFMNTYLINFANFYYDDFTLNAFIKLLENLNKEEPTQETRNIIKQLINGKDVKYNGITIPGCIRDNGTLYNINLLQKQLGINSIKFKDEIPNDSFISLDSLENADAINEWNAYSDVILPIILSQPITVTYEDNYGNETTTIVYNNGKFVKDAIRPASASGDFNTSYTTTKIKSISLGNVDTKPFLGTNTYINDEASFTSFVNNSKLYKTKTINNVVYANENGFDDPISIKASKDGIDIKFRYVSEEREVEEGAWADYSGDDVIEPKLLIPNEAWSDLATSNPDSPLIDLIYDDQFENIVGRALARPFVLSKEVTTEILTDARNKFVDKKNYNVMTFTKAQIASFYLQEPFTKKYSEMSSKPWWTWTFKELAQEETNFNNGVAGAMNVFQDNSRQDGFFKTFICNPNLQNMTMEDFFPKYDEGRFFVIGSYTPAIDSTQVQLTEEAGFYAAGNQYDNYHEITNINYVVELEVKNKTYTSKLGSLNFGSTNYNGQKFSLSKYEQVMKQTATNLVEYFALDSARFKKGQIQQPKIEYIPVASDNPFLGSTYGYIKVDYQDTLPIVNQIGNEVVYEQLPFDLFNVKGMKEFQTKYAQYILVDIDEYNSLSKEEQSSKILIDTNNNEIRIGGRVLAKEQNFSILGMNAKVAIMIPEEYLDPSINTFYGFDQRTKSYTSLEELKTQWASYTQDELFDILFGNYNYNNQAQLLKDTLKENNVTLHVDVNEEGLKIWWSWFDEETQEEAFNEIINPLKLTRIEAVRLDKIETDKITYGYQRSIDSNLSFTGLVSQLSKIDSFAKYFNLSNDEKQNFISGISKVEVLEYYIKWKLCSLQWIRFININN